MAKIARFVQKIFGSNSQADEIKKFGSLAAGTPANAADPDEIQELANYLDGWPAAVLGNNSPTIEDRNSLDFLVSRQLAYLFQQGIAEWDNDTEYHIGSLATWGSRTYISITDDNQGNSITDLDHWRDLNRDKFVDYALSNWTARDAAEANAWTSVCYGEYSSGQIAGLFVAVARTGTNRIMTSPDGVNWDAVSAPEIKNYRSVCWGDGLFVAVGDDAVMTSPDGSNWTARTPAEANDWQSVCYGGGQFVAVSDDGTNRVMTSPDGITWTSRSAAGGFSITYGNGLFVSTFSNNFYTSPDGITWTSRLGNITGNINSVTYGAGYFVAIAGLGSNRIIVSKNGINWEARVAPDTGIIAYKSVCFGAGARFANNMFVAVAETGTNRVITSGIFSDDL